MKNVVKMVMVLAALLVLGVGQVWAYPITSGDIVSLQTSYGGVNGEFKVFDQNGVLIQDTNGMFLTFCLENDVTFVPKTKYIATIDDYVLQGDNPGEFKRELNVGTKYLYWNFVNGSLGYTSSALNAAALQHAIWKLEGYNLSLSDAQNNAAKVYLDIVDGITNIADVVAGYNVKVMNLWVLGEAGAAKQSQLIAGPAPVPEPGTLLLLGSGLAGLALYCRRTRK